MIMPKTIPKKAASGKNKTLRLPSPSPPSKESKCPLWSDTYDMWPCSLWS